LVIEFSPLSWALPTSPVVDGQDRAGSTRSCIFYPSAHGELIQIKSAVEKIDLGSRLRRIGIRGIGRHGAVAGPTRKRGMIPD
jgi:hypothetical protein